MDQARKTSWMNWMAIIQWIWTQVKRPFSYMLDNSPHMVDMDASNQEETLVCVSDATSGPSVSNLQTITKPIQLDIGASSSGCIDSSSTTTPARRWKYDVFLSFRGTDTRQGITVDIRDRLQNRGIKTFMDDPDLRVGDSISDKLMEAIEGSKFAIVVLSPNYASSSWCLDELVKICECMRNNERILPLFYNVQPTEVRHQKGTFKEAFTKHEESGRHQPETVDKWKSALKQVVGYSAWTTNAFKTHRELVNNVVETLRSKTSPNAIEITADFQAYEETLKAMDEVNEALRDEKVTVVGVHGMGGVGKTTMVSHLAEQACINGTFQRCIKVTISQNHQVKKIQYTLADFLGIELKEKTEVGRAAKLHEEILRREKLLIIMDDVWDEIDLSKIGIPNSKGLEECNSKMLLTTRIGHVCHTMECHKIIQLEGLSDEDSWTLFQRKARRSFNPTFEGVARKVAKECGGLPIALVTVASALADKNLHEWKRAAQRLENSQRANPNDDGKALECIRLSYDHLKDEYKPFFLLCCLFSEDDNIEIEDLFMYAMGKQLFRDVDTLEQARMDAKIWAGHLQDSCLLLGRDGEDIKMHDVVRDTAIQISGSFVKVGCGLKAWPRQIHEDCTAISLMNSDISKLPENLVCPKLQILLLNENFYLKEIPETFFQSPNDLRVLDLDLHNLSLLPQSISLLTNLTFLSLDGCDQASCDISILGNLKKLEILYLLEIELEELSMELGGLTNLRIFNCKGFIERIPPGVISKWHNLEELRMKSYSDWGRKVEGDEEENITAGFEEVTSLSKLKVLQATLFDIENLPELVDPVPQWTEFNIIIGNRVPNLDSPSEGKSIELFNLNISHLPDWFRNGLMKRAESLTLGGCKDLSDIFVDLEHGWLPKLRDLWIGRDNWQLYFRNNEIEQSSEDENGESSEDEIGESFTQDESHRNPIRTFVLEKLFLYSKLDWEKSLEVVQTLPPGSLLNLKQLNLQFCYADGNALISSAKLQTLPNLEEIYIDSTSNRYIFRHDELFVSLQIRKIILERCSIISICEGRAPPTIFQNLQRVVISYCIKLEGSLFTHEVAQCLPQLDALILQNCPLLERIVEAGNNKTILPKLRKLHLWACPVLYSESGSLDIECPSLEIFGSPNCPKFAASFDDFNSRKQQKLLR